MAEMSEALAQPDNASCRLSRTPLEWEGLARGPGARAPTLVDLWGDGRHRRLATLRCRGRPDRDRGAGLSRGRLPVGRPASCAGDPPRTHAPRPVWARTASGRRMTGRWLDHGCWPVRQPLGSRRPHEAAGDTYPFLPVEGEGLHQIPVGPVHAGIIEPGHFRFTCSGETVVRLEERLGYVHKGIEGLMRGAAIDTGGAAGRPDLGRQHGRLCDRVQPRGRSCARHRAAASVRSGCAPSWPNSNASPTISAISARSATTPPSP